MNCPFRTFCPRTRCPLDNLSWDKVSGGQFILGIDCSGGQQSGGHVILGQHVYNYTYVHYVYQYSILWHSLFLDLDERARACACPAKNVLLGSSLSLASFFSQLAIYLDLAPVPMQYVSVSWMGLHQIAYEIMCAGIHHPTRGGTRGGKDQFDWDDVKADKDRECYLGTRYAYQ